MIPPFLEDVPLIGIFRGISPATALPAAEAAARGGIRALEVTMNSENATELLAEILRQIPGITVGAGTVMSIAEARVALDAGAQFIVSPHLDEDLVAFCVRKDVPVFPGAMTPSEVWRAHCTGATMVKLFPAATLGSDYIRALRGPLPQIDLLVTGGIDADNLRSFLDAGAKGAAIGGRLFPKEALQCGDVSSVETEAAHLVAVCRRRS